MSISRRKFIGASIALASCASAPKKPKEGEVTKRPAADTRAEMPMRPLGKTGVTVSAIGIGGFHIGMPEEAEGVRIIHSAIDRGVTFMDNCWDYHKGKSEERMGRALAQGGYRQKVFLMTKIDAHPKRPALEQIEQSLRRLQTDVIDLVQIHEVIRPTDPADCFRSGGSIEALLEAKQAGKLRFIGFTGHKDPEIHLDMLRTADANGFAFDTVQMPLNVMDAHFQSFGQKVLPVLVEQGIGVLGMKPFASGDILKTNTVQPMECLHYAMNLPTSVVITGCDAMAILDQAIEAAVTFKPMDDAQVAEILSRTREVALAGKYERFKTTTDFDGTVENPHWLTGSEA